MRVLKLLGVTLVAPAFGLLVGLLSGAAWLTNLALVGGLMPIVLVGLPVTMARMAGRDRALMARIFPILTRTTVYGMVVMVAVQTVVALGALWLGEAALLNQVHFGILITVGLGAIAAAWALIRAALASAQRPMVHAVGRALTPDQAPRLFAHVRGLAERLGAHTPDHIVVGLDATFYVTSADVLVLNLGQRLQGETLYISSTLARLFTPTEMDAVIGHELDHFRGQDTAYSLRFAPVYASLGHAVGGIVNAEGQVAWAALPAVHVLSFLYDLFAEAEASVSRDRELEADRAGVEAASAPALATSLMKVSIHVDAWHAAMGDLPALGADAAQGSLALAFRRKLVSSFDEAAWRMALEEGLGAAVAHPIDSHPPIRTRLAALGIDPDLVDTIHLLPPQDLSGAELIDGLDEIDRERSQIYIDAAAPAFVAPSVLTEVTDGSGEPQHT